MTGILYDTNVVIDVASRIVTGCATALDDAGLPANRAFVTSGEVAWDDCSCGQLALSISGTYRTESIRNAQQQRSGSGCHSSLVVVDMRLSIIRCVPIPDINGIAPTPAALTAAAVDSENDKFIVGTTLSCLLDTMLNGTPRLIQDYEIGDQLSIGPLGGCGGSEIGFRVSWVNCGDC